MKKMRQILLAFGWYDHHVHAGIVRYAREQRWCLRIAFSHGDLPERWHGDGIILCSPINKLRQTFAQLIDASAVPTVITGEELSDTPTARIALDERAIGRLAAQHFTNLSFKHFLWLGDHKGAVGNLIRLRCFREALQETGNDCNIMWWSDFGNRKDYRGSDLVQVLRQSPKPLALFAVSDLVAARVMHACLEAEISVPEDVAILGVDNDELYWDCTPIPLSSVDSQQKEKGYMAARLLDLLLQGQAMPTTTFLVPPAEVIVRGSTDIQATSHPQVRKAIEFIRNHYWEKILVEDIARHVAMSKEGLRKAFKQSIRQSPGMLLRKRRLDQAKILLKTTNLKLESIAAETGLRDATRLCCTFRRELGMSPAAYRKAYKAKRTLKIQ